MRDIIKCAGSGESREHLLRRMALAGHLWFWNCGPAEEVRRMYVVHRGEIIGWMNVVGVEYMQGEVTIRWHDGSRRKQHGIRTITQSPLHLIDPPVLHKGFRGFRYFNFDEYLADFSDVPKLEVLTT